MDNNMNKHMNTIYYLSTCSTCKRIISELLINERDFYFRDMKEEIISESELKHIQNISGLSAEELFNKRAMKYKKDMFTTDEEYKKGILSEYTFIKRPIITIDGVAYVGNSPKVVAAAKKALSK